MTSAVQRLARPAEFPYVVASNDQLRPPDQRAWREAYLLPLLPGTSDGHDVDVLVELCKVSCRQPPFRGASIGGADRKRSVGFIGGKRLRARDSPLEVALSGWSQQAATVSEAASAVDEVRSGERVMLFMPEGPTVYIICALPAAAAVCKACSRLEYLNPRERPQSAQVLGLVSVQEVARGGASEDEVLWQTLAAKGRTQAPPRELRAYRWVRTTMQPEPRHMDEWCQPGAELTRLASAPSLSRQLLWVSESLQEGAEAG